MVAAYNTPEYKLSPWLAKSRRFYAAESWLATLNSAAHAHLAIGAYLAYRRIDPYR